MPGSGGGGSLSLFTEEEESAKMEPTKEYLLDGSGASSASMGIFTNSRLVRGGEMRQDAAQNESNQCLLDI